MTQQQALHLFLPILIAVPFLYFRMRKMARAQPLKLNRLWIRPALILAIAALVLVAPSPGHQPAHVLTPVDWAWMALAAALGAVAGWQWGRTMAIEVHPHDGTLMVRGGMAPTATATARSRTSSRNRTGVIRRRRLGNANTQEA